MTKKLWDPNKPHIKRKTCLKCGTVWEIEWYDSDAWVEHLLCANCRPRV